MMWCCVRHCVRHYLRRVAVDNEEPGLLCLSRELMMDTILDIPYVLGCRIRIDGVVEMLRCQPLCKVLLSCFVPCERRWGFLEQRPDPRNSTADQFLDIQRRPRTLENELTISASLERVGRHLKCEVWTVCLGRRTAARASSSYELLLFTRRREPWDGAL
jgi:hypothetical protein